MSIETGPEPGMELSAQACSSAQPDHTCSSSTNELAISEWPISDSTEPEQTPAGEQSANAQAEQVISGSGSGGNESGEQVVGGSNPLGERRTLTAQGSTGEKSGEQGAAFQIERRRADRGSSEKGKDEPPGERDEHAPQWLKTILPEPSSGWWDVYPREKGFSIKFCWRDPERQTLTFPGISYAQYRTLLDGDLKDAVSTVHQQVIAALQGFLLDPGRREKAAIVAGKLGIELNSANTNVNLS